MNLKDVLLRQLISAQKTDGFISGEELAEQCNISRTAVWKAVNALRKQGAKIEAVTNRGYRLINSEIFNAEAVNAKLPANSGVKIVFFKSIDSTNTEAKRRLALAPQGELHKTVLSFACMEQRKYSRACKNYGCCSSCRLPRIKKHIQRGSKNKMGKRYLYWRKKSLRHSYGRNCKF